MWVEETLGEKIATLRAKELIDTEAERIVASCPFCITMLTDGVKAAERGDVAVMDIAEIVAASLG